MRSLSGGWITEMAAAAAKGAAAATGGAEEAIGNVAAGANAGAQGDAASVKGIAAGMKGIVEAAKKMGVELKVGAVAEADAAANTVGHLFASGGAVQAANASPVSVAIGANNGAGADFAAGMTHNDKIAAAIVLRGMAKDGKFALARAEGAAVNGLKSTVEELNVLITEMAADGAQGNAAGGAQGDAASVKGIAAGMKGIVAAAKKMGVELKVGEVAAAADDALNVGNLFASGGAVQAANASPVSVAIGANNGAGGNFGQAGILQNDKIAAAIVLRGMAKDGKFALANGEDDAVKGLKSTVEKLSGWI
ncbi:variable large family protein [Borreliella lusitaniae]|uniref:variable large family protein n=1 Tax=Borreliella lusitaniae TaxID=100177 RepID=UPI003AB5E1FC